MGILSIIGRGLSSAFSWLLKNPTVLLMGVISAMFLMVVVSKNSVIDTLNKSIKEKDARIERSVAAITTLRNNNMTLSESLKVQSDSIVALQKQGEQAGVKFDQLMAGMAASNATTAKKLSALDSAKPGPDKCTSAQALIKGAVQ